MTPAERTRMYAACCACCTLATAMKDCNHCFFRQPQFGPQEPPADYRIFNRRRPDGTYPPLSEFFDSAVRKADATTEPATVHDAEREAYGEGPEFGSAAWFAGIPEIEP